MDDACTDARGASGLPDALLLLIGVWAILIASGALVPLIGRGATECVAFGSATLLCAFSRAGSSASGSGPAAPRRVRTAALARIVAAALAGAALLPALAHGIAWLGLTLGLPPIRAYAPTGLSLLGSLILAPCFEEMLYRERVLEAVRRSFGATAALLCSSALFAAAHLAPWSILGTFVAGLLLGAVRLATGRLTEGIGLHAGLNLGCHALVAAPPLFEALPAAVAGLAAGTVLLLWLVMSGRPRR